MARIRLSFQKPGFSKKPGFFTRPSVTYSRFDVALISRDSDGK